MISYAQNFEDVILARVFAGHKKGFYIDVGAGDPAADSVTKYFYDIGWRGINLEPHKTKFAELSAARPRDINLNVAASAKSGKTTFFELDAWGLSGVTDEVLDVAEDLKVGAKAYRVKTQTLAHICRQHIRSEKIDFLKIDVEGAERDVLSGMDFAKYPATVVLVEATQANSQIENHAKWEDILLKAGYIFSYFDGLNRFYLHPSAKKLHRKLSLPPNVFDNFKRQPEVYYQERYEEASRAVISANENLNVIQQQLASEREQSKDALARLQTESDGSARLASELESERQRTAEATARSNSLAAELEAQQKQMVEAATQTASLASELEAKRQRAAEATALAASLDDELEFERRRAARAVTQSITLADELEAERRHATDMTARSANYAEQLEAERRNAMEAAGRSARLVAEFEARHAAEAEQSKNELIWERSERNRLEAELQQRVSQNEQFAEALAQKETEAARLETELRQQVSAQEQMRDNLTQQRLENELVLYKREATVGSGWGGTSALRRGARVFRRLQQDMKYHVWRFVLRSFGWMTPRPLKRRVERRVQLLRGAKIIESSNIFSPTWYFSQNTDVRAMGADPLLHYLAHGAAEGRDPCPMFDSDWYLAQNPDVHATGMNPLVHYVEHGAAEGRDPCPMFDSDWYLTQYSDVIAKGMNPLAHYLRHGAAERRSCFFASHLANKPIAIVQDESAAYRIENLATGFNRPDTAGKRLVICVTHELPWPSQAGNQYRIAQILDWLAKKGYELLVVVVPMGDVPLSDKNRAAAFQKYNNVVVCYRRGLVQTSFKTLSISVDSLHRRLVKDVFERLKNSNRNRNAPIHEFERNNCHEALIGLMAEIARQVPDAIYYLNYAFMTRILDYLPHKNPSFVDTHDIFSQKSKKVFDYGIRGEIPMTADEERRMLRRADALLAIQRDDAQELRTLVPGKPVLTVGVDFKCVDVGSPSTSPTILMVANDNALNTKGVHDFLRFAWPPIKSAVPNVRFIAVGLIGKVVRTDDPQVILAGVVDSLTPYYKQARVVINPAVAGTGLKIKTVESIAYMRPIVTWPHGVDGIGDPLIRQCHVAENWYDFAEKVIALLSNKKKDANQAADQSIIRSALEADVVYRELGSWLAECNDLTPAIGVSST